MKILVLWMCVVLLVACTTGQKEDLTASGLKRSHFQTEVSGKKTDLFVLKNKHGGMRHQLRRTYRFCAGSG